MPIFTTLGAACAKAWGFTSGLITDQYFNLVSLLLPGNGTNGAQNNTFLDSSTNNFTITRNGDTTQGTFSPFSQTGWGNYFDGSSYLSLSNGAVLAAGTSNFTAEFWVYATTDQLSQVYGSVFHVGSGTSGAFAISLLYSSAGAMKIRFGTSSADYDSTSTISTNRWYHIAVVREGTGSNQTKMYVDGSLFYTFTLSDNLSNSSGLYVGSTAFNLSVRRLSGYVSNLRYTVGTALYTGAFTPSTSPLTTTSQGATASQVELLTCQNNRFLDNSSNGWTFTTSGSPSVTPFSPFAPTAKYEAAAVGGSGYFDGSGDYLTAPDNAAWDVGSSNFTIEGWFYPTGSPAQPILIGQWTSSYSWVMLLSNDSNRYIRGILYNGSAFSDYVSTAPLQLNAWNHCAFVRESNTVSLYLNGSRVLTNTFTGSVATSTSAVSLGANSSGADPYLGYMSSTRVVVGTALYSGTTYTVPTAPLTAVSGTQLLLNFTNAGVVDATAKNVLETEGNAQISNGAGGGKWGGGSIAFDGTGDYLQAPISTMWDLGTGDFVVEMWIYYSTTSRNGSLVSYGGYGFASSDSTGWSLQINATYGNLAFSTGTTQNIFISSNNTLINSTLPNGQWNHIAISRNGTNLRCYINGSQIGSTITNSTSLSGASYTPKIGGDQTAAAGSLITGYIDDFRITKGSARGYTGATITVPTAPFPVQ